MRPLPAPFALAAFATALPLAASDVDGRAQRIVLDEFASRLDHVAHQLSEDVVGFVDFLDLHLQQRSVFVVAASIGASLSDRL